MVWDNTQLSVLEVTEAKKKTPRFPSRERNFAVRRRGLRQSGGVGVGVCLGASPMPTTPEPDCVAYTIEDRLNGTIADAASGTT